MDAIVPWKLRAILESVGSAGLGVAIRDVNLPVVVVVRMSVEPGRFDDIAVVGLGPGSIPTDEWLPVHVERFDAIANHVAHGLPRFLANLVGEGPT